MISEKMLNFGFAGGMNARSFAAYVRQFNSPRRPSGQTLAQLKRSWRKPAAAKRRHPDVREAARALRDQWLTVTAVARCGCPACVAAGAK